MTDPRVVDEAVAANAIGIDARVGGRLLIVMDELTHWDGETDETPTTEDGGVPTEAIEVGTPTEVGPPPEVGPPSEVGLPSEVGPPPEVGPPLTPSHPIDELSPGGAWWRGPFQGIRALLETIVPALLIAVAINLFLAQATQVQGQSMEPNLHTAQRLVVEKLTYRFHGPRRGDIVVIDLPEAGPDLLIKRVIGLPGETVSSKAGQVLINGEPLKEPYVNNSGGRDVSEQIIPPLHVFVMGDNRRFSNDSRNFGPVPIDDIIGRAWFSYWPLELWGPID